MAGSDAAKVTALDWAIIGAGLLAFVSSLLPWYVFTARVPFFGITQSADVNAWNAGTGAWLSVLLLIAAAGVVLAGTMGGRPMRAASRSLITLVISALAFITIVLRLVTFPDPSGGLGRVGDLVHFDLGDINLSGVLSFSSGAGYGLYLGMAAAAVATVASLITFLAASRDIGPSS
ncbi:MAG: hypothetical protein ACRDRA_11880 [Pseudonocardiaceae bacterium]